MTPEQAQALLTLVATAHDRTTPAGLGDIWAATLADIPFDIGRTATLEVLKSNPHLPKVAEIREKARLVAGTRERALAVNRQLEARRDAPGPNGRSFTQIYRFVAQRLSEAGQNVSEVDFASPRSREQHLLGKERCALIAEAACAEWLDKHGRN